MRYWHTKSPRLASDAGIALLEAAAAAVLLLILFCGGLAVSDFLYKGANISEIVDQHLYDTGARVFHARAEFNRISLELDQNKIRAILDQRISAIESETLHALLKVRSADQISNGVIAASLYRVEGVAAVIDFNRSNGIANNITLINQHSRGSYSPSAEQLERTELRAAIERFVDFRGSSTSAFAIPTGAWGDANSEDRYLSNGALIAVRAFVSLDNSAGGWFSRYFQGPQGVSAVKVVPFRGDLDT